MRGIMKLRTVTVASLLALSSPSFAQPKQPAKQPPAAPPATPPPAAAPTIPDELAAFDKDLDALFAQGGLTSDQAAARASGASPSVRRKAAEIDAALAGVDAAKLVNVPQVSAKLAATKLSSIPGISLPVGGMDFVISFPSHDYQALGQVAVPISDYFLKFPKVIDSAELAVTSARVGKRTAEVGASQDARLAYYELVRARLQVLVAQRSLAQVQATLNQVRALAENQRLSRADLMRVESQEAQAEQTLDQLKNLGDLREEQLRLLIGAGPEEKLGLGEDVRAISPAQEGATLDAAVTTAKAQRLEFKEIDTGIALTEKQRESEKAGLYPHLSAFGQADYEDPNPREFPAQDHFKFTWAVGLQITWTLNDALAANANDKKYIAQVNELRADKENLERGTRIELLAAQQAVAIATHALQTTQKGLEAAQESYRVRRELLNAERATAVDLVDTETDLTRARIASLNARVDLRVAQAQLTHALGNDAK